MNNKDLMQVLIPNPSGLSAQAIRPITGDVSSIDNSVSLATTIYGSQPGSLPFQPLRIIGFRPTSDSQDVDEPDLGLVAAGSFGYGYNAAADRWARLRSVALDGNIIPASAVTTGVQAVAGAPLMALPDGTFYPQRGAAVDNLSSTAVDAGSAMVSLPGQWAITSAPAAATVATITRPADPTGRHVCNTITATLTCAAAQASLLVVLRDGATGVGPILWQGRMACLAGDGQTLVVSGLNIVGSLNTAMTLEFTAAPAATNFETVALTGHTAFPV
jgi:hypothetical protein